MNRVTLVGELNPLGSDPAFALYPDPPGCAGARLCYRILNMGWSEYLLAFNRVNLCTGRWSLAAATSTAIHLQAEYRVLLGAKVCRAHGLPFTPLFRVYNKDGYRALVIPHPSGLCRLWNRPGVISEARMAVEKFRRIAAGRVADVNTGAVNTC